MKRTSGFSLVEMLVTVVVSLILLAGVAQVFVSSKQGYRVQESAGQLQDSARFALFNIDYFVRMADFWSAVQPSQVAMASSGTVNYPGPSGATICENGWLINPLDGLHGYAGGTSPPSAIDCFQAADYVPNSDVLVVRYADADAYYTSANTTSGPCTTVPSNGSVFLKSSIDRKGILFNVNPSDSGDCAAATTAIPGDYPAGVLNYQYQVVLMFLRPCEIKNGNPTCPANSTTPTLTLMTLTSGSSSTSYGFTQTPLVNGVEMMKFSYGVDTNNDLSVDSYMTAAAVESAGLWPHVLSVRAYLIVRGNQIDNYKDTNEYPLPDGTYYTVTDPTAQRYQRRLVVEEMQVRNRVLAPG